MKFLKTLILSMFAMLMIAGTAQSGMIILPEVKYTKEDIAKTKQELEDAQKKANEEQKKLTRGEESPEQKEAAEKAAEEVTKLQKQLEDEENKQKMITPEDILKQASLAATKGVPKVSIYVLKCRIGITDDFAIPFLLNANTHIESRGSARDTSDTLLDEDGGLLNASLRELFPIYRWMHTQSDSTKIDETLGLFGSIDVGAKLVGDLFVEGSDSPKEFFTYYAGPKLQLVLPVMEYDDSIPSSDSRQPKTRAGKAILDVSFIGNYVHSSAYEKFFGDDVKNLYWVCDGTISFFIIDNINFSFGGTLWRSEDKFDRRVYLSFNLVK